MAQRQPKKVSLTEEKRFALADMIAKTCNKPSAEALNANRKYYFGQIINQPLRINGEVTSLSARYEEETAMHVTNLILTRLSTTDLFSATTTLSVEE